MSRLNSLGPHTFAIPHEHHSHHGWLSHFSHRERQQQLKEDLLARNTVAALLALLMLSGLSMVVAMVIACL